MLNIKFSFYNSIVPPTSPFFALNFVFFLLIFHSSFILANIATESNREKRRKMESLSDDGTSVQVIELLWIRSRQRRANKSDVYDQHERCGGKYWTSSRAHPAFRSYENWIIKSSGLARVWLITHSRVRCETAAFSPLLLSSMWVNNWLNIFHFNGFHELFLYFCEIQLGRRV